jgi:hypothetical protein
MATTQCEYGDALLDLRFQEVYKLPLTLKNKLARGIKMSFGNTMN